ncbi:hypothetical protein BDV12DRAFT_165767 [Aspergillus spectabilis]
MVPSFTAEDIIDRVHPDYRTNISEAIIQHRCAYFREHFSVTCWEQGHENTNPSLIRALETKGINTRLNSTRGLTPGLINLAMGEAGRRILLPPESQCDIRQILAPSGCNAYNGVEVFRNNNGGF